MNRTSSGTSSGRAAGPASDADVPSGIDFSHAVKGKYAPKPRDADEARQMERAALRGQIERLIVERDEAERLADERAGEIERLRAEIERLRASTVVGARP